MLLFIDNYDSFTYNIVQYLQVLEQDVHVYKNDEISLAKVSELQPKAIIIGPGPCYPQQAGISLMLIERFAGVIPILGICLGHQAIGRVFGAKVVPAEQVMHGRISQVYHTGEGVFVDIPSPFNATRYHSLLLEKETLPSCLQVTAWTQEWTENEQARKKEIMAIRHRTLPIEGVQFHPESILSDYGYPLLNNFIKKC